MTLPTVYAEARIIGAPELRFLPNGQPVLNLRLVSNRRKYDEATKAWVDAGVCWLNGAIWGKPGENAAAFLQDKDLVQYAGELETREWEKDGQKHSRTEVTIRSIGKVPPRLEQGGAQQGGGQFQSQGGGQFPSQGGGQFQQQQQRQPQGGGWGGPVDDEPPF